MCGRLSLSAPNHRAAAELLAAAVPGFEAEGLARWLAAANYEPHTNLGPGQDHWLVRGRAHRPIMGTGRWGFEHRGQARTKLVINARSETLDQRPMFRSAFAHGRALVPADGFFEWQREGKRRQPHWFHREDRSALLLAALFEPPRGDTPERFCVITRPASDDLSWVHPRMPVIIAPEAVETWLFGAPPQLHALMAATPPTLHSLPLAPS